MSYTRNQLEMMTLVEIRNLAIYAKLTGAKSHLTKAKLIDAILRAQQRQLPQPSVQRLYLESLRIDELRRLPEYAKLSGAKSHLTKAKLIDAILKYRHHPRQPSPQPSHQRLYLESLRINELRGFPEYAKLTGAKSHLTKAKLIDAILKYRHPPRLQQPSGRRYTKSELEKMTLTQIRNTQLYKKLDPLKKMLKKNNLIQALLKFQDKPTQQRPASEKGTWQKKCKEMERKCPVDTNFVGDTWCEQPETLVVNSPNYSSCFNKEEVMKITHTGFTALDLSYQVPPLRLQLPRDPYNRKLIPKVVFADIKKNLFTAKNQQEIKKIIWMHDELSYFLKHLDDFYTTFDKPKYTKDEVTPVELSKDLENWFLKHKRPDYLVFERLGRDEIMWAYNNIVNFSDLKKMIY